MGESNREQALHEMSQVLSERGSVRANLERHLTVTHFGHLPRGGFFVGPWRTSPSGDITCIELMGLPFLLGNLKIAMFKEAMGIGPSRYCIYFSHGADFFQKLRLIMIYLPQEKMFLYPPGQGLGGPFLREPWLSRGRALLSRPSLTGAEFHEYFVESF